jgi:hypothetical protein
MDQRQNELERSEKRGKQVEEEARREILGRDEEQRDMNSIPSAAAQQARDSLNEGLEREKAAARVQAAVTAAEARRQ